MAVGAEEDEADGPWEWIGCPQEDPTLKQVIAMVQQGKPLGHIEGLNRKLLTPYNKCWAQLRVKDGLLL